MTHRVVPVLLAVRNKAKMRPGMQEKEGGPSWKVYSLARSSDASFISSFCSVVSVRVTAPQMSDSGNARCLLVWPRGNCDCGLTSDQPFLLLRSAPAMDFDKTSSCRAVNDYGRAYQYRATELIKICRLFSTASHQSLDQDIRLQRYSNYPGL